jgi:hypothetical protein
MSVSLVLYTSYFSLVAAPMHINNTHISLNCLALSSEARARRKGMKKVHYCTLQKNGTARPCTFAIIRRVLRAVRCRGFKKKVFTQNPNNGSYIQFPSADTHTEPSNNHSGLFVGD